jgi:type I restriction enzyme M protein
MSLALNKPKLDNLANEIWKSAERLRGKFKAVFKVKIEL